MEARELAEHPAMRRTVPTTKNDPGPCVSSAEVEKLWFKAILKSSLYD